MGIPQEDKRRPDAFGRPFDNPKMTVARKSKGAALAGDRAADGLALIRATRSPRENVARKAIIAREQATADLKQRMIIVVEIQVRHPPLVPIDSEVRTILAAINSGSAISA